MTRLVPKLQHLNFSNLGHRLYEFVQPISWLWLQWIFWAKSLMRFSFVADLLKYFKYCNEIQVLGFSEKLLLSLIRESVWCNTMSGVIRHCLLECTNMTPHYTLYNCTEMPRNCCFYRHCLIPYLNKKYSKGNVGKLLIMSFVWEFLFVLGPL